MSVQAITWALSVQTGSPSAKCVLVAIANYADERGICWPSQELLAFQTDQSVDSIQRRLKELEKMGLLQRRIRQRASCVYYLLMPKMLMPQSAVSNIHAEVLIPQNSPLKPQLCGTEPPKRTQRVKDTDKVTGGKKGKPSHGRMTKDRKRIWIDRGTTDWEAYCSDYRDAHNGIEPKTNWADTGAWFNYGGE